MAIKASNQITLIDLTDGYSVILTNESYTFLGTTDSVSGTQVTTTTVQALCGNEVVACTVPKTITAPNGMSIVSDGKSPAPTLTITATSALKQSGSIVIPVTIGDIVISKTFSYTIAFKGAAGQSVTVSNTSVTYQASTSGTVQPTGQWVTSPPAVPPGQYLWTKTVVTYSDGKSTTAFTVSRQGVNGQNGAAGQNGTSVTITGTSVTYASSTSGTSAPSSGWVSNPPAVAPGQYLWTKTVVTYSDGKSTTSYSVSRQGQNGQNGHDGADGKDALSMVIISSNGNIFKNTNIATTLSAHVYKGGVEVTGSALTALGTIKWYKDGAASSFATGTNLIINPGDVKNNANYTAQLEG